MPNISEAVAASNSGPEREAAAAAPSFPSQAKYIVGTEACERFSFYGMSSILVVYMVHRLMMAEEDAKAIYHLFVSAAYFFPLLGGYLSDRYLGKYKTILYLSLFYCLGHGTLAISESKTALYIGLFLIALGAGGVKPTVSAMVGDQFTGKSEELMKRVYALFYWAINMGSISSYVIIPWVLPRYGARWAFGIPGILMGLAVLIFWLGRDLYVKVPPTGDTGPTGFMPIALYALKNWGKKKEGESLLDVARQQYSAEDVDAAKAALSVIKLFAMISVFWALFFQYGSSWVLQAEHMNLTVFGYKLEASQLGTLQPLMVLIFIPIFSFWVYPLMDRVGFPMTPLRRMSTGMVVTAFSFVAAGAIQVLIDHGHVISVAWQTAQYLILSIAEIMVSITGLEFAYSQAPRSMKTTLMSFWILTFSVGSLLTAVVSKINVFKGPAYFFFFAGLMFVVAVLFIISATRFKVQNHYEGASA